MNYKLNLCESRIYIEIGIRLSVTNKWQFTLVINNGMERLHETMDPIFMTAKQALNAALTYLRFHANAFPAQSQLAVAHWSRQKLVTFY